MSARTAGEVRILLLCELSRVIEFVSAILSETAPDVAKACGGFAGISRAGLRFVVSRAIE
jgi:hypothetical protein